MMHRPRPDKPAPALPCPALDAGALYARECLILAREALHMVFSDDGKALKDPARRIFLRETYRKLTIATTAL